ncbi:hypothetical protein GCM10008967_32910 [Bacillus carboniphilus]|uniref:AB hydrolase-1 domain-containing protein n=1 Tax=Bacillus carboniphilus TaxID=86663 RepID=A0ABN0WJU1_9BACI
MERYIQLESAKIWTYKQGKGTPVILISGGPGTANYLEPVASLIDETCEVIMFDPRGCGRSSFDGVGYDLEVCLGDLEIIREAYGYSKWTVIGHSWGADVGLAYSLLYPNAVDKFVSISGTGIQNDRDWKEVYNRNKNEVSEAMPHFDFPHNKVVHRTLIDSWRRFIKSPHLLKNLSEFRIPTLFVWAENDIRPAWPIQQLANLISNSSYVEVKGAEHYIWLQKDNELREILAEFLQR